MESAPANLDELVEVAKNEREKASRELREITMLVEQSRGEVEKLTQRNAMLGNRIVQLEANFDTVPRGDIKNTFEEALDVQQRLFTMRGQLEKLQSDQQSLNRYTQFLDQTLVALGQADPEALALMDSGESPNGTVSRPKVANAQQMIARIIDAQESERLRLSRAMHDGPAQSLTNFVLQAEIVQRLFDSDPERARSELNNLKSAATSTFQKVREFISELRPMMLDDLGLAPTVRRYVNTFSEKSGIQVSVSVLGEEQRLESHSEVFAFRGIQELLDNARKHSQATSVRTTLDFGDINLRVLVEDNGRGFNPAEVLGEGADTKAIGLPSLKERAELLGGALTVDSNPGEGTKIEITIPAIDIYDE